MINNTFDTIKVPLRLDQLAIALRQLPPSKWEDLELMLDQEFETTILQRGKNARQDYKKGETLTLKELQKEFSE